MSLRKSSVFILLVAQVLMLVYVIRMYINTRLELMEAQNLIGGLLIRDTNTKKQLIDGAHMDLITDRLSANQRFEMIYMCKRNVMCPEIHSFIAFHVKNGNIVLNKEELKLFEVYNTKYKKWEGGSYSDFKCRIPVIDQIERGLYARWDDRLELWPMWKSISKEHDVNFTSLNKGSNLQ